MTSNGATWNGPTPSSAGLDDDGLAQGRAALAKSDFQTTVSVPAGAYAVKLPVFEGPLDLLLHLIRQNEVDITDIPVAQIGAQYLQYLELMGELNLEVAGEYLVMAATLALIKSRMLLPPSGEEDEDELGDPRAELVARLLEYQRYKEVAEELSRKRLLGRDVFESRSSDLDPVPEGQREIEVGLFELLESLRQLLQGADDPARVHEVEVETVTVRERMLAVMKILEGTDSIEFMQIFRSDDGSPAGRPVIIATFLAILELARLTALRIYQGVGGEGAPAGPIRLRVVREGEPIDWSARISEHM